MLGGGAGCIGVRPGRECGDAEVGLVGGEAEQLRPGDGGDAVHCNVSPFVSQSALASQGWSELACNQGRPADEFHQLEGRSDISERRVKSD